MLKNRKELMDCAQSMYEALLSRAAQRYFDNAVYTLVDRVGAVSYTHLTLPTTPYV